MDIFCEKEQILSLCCFWFSSAVTWPTLTLAAILEEKSAVTCYLKSVEILYKAGKETSVRFEIRETALFCWQYFAFVFVVIRKYCRQCLTRIFPGYQRMSDIDRECKQKILPFTLWFLSTSYLMAWLRLIIFIQRR